MDVVGNIRSCGDNLTRKIKDPQFDIHNKVNPVVSALVELLQANGKDMAAIGGNYFRR